MYSTYGTVNAVLPWMVLAALVLMHQIPDVPVSSPVLVRDLQTAFHLDRQQLWRNSELSVVVVVNVVLRLDECSAVASVLGVKRRKRFEDRRRKARRAPHRSRMHQTNHSTVRVYTVTLYVNTLTHAHAVLSRSLTSVSSARF